MAIRAVILHRNFSFFIGSGGWIADTVVRGLSITTVRIRCLLTVRTILRSPRYWATLCWSTFRSILTPWCTCWCLWDCHNWIRTPKGPQVLGDDLFKVAVALYVMGTLVRNFFSTRKKILD